MTIIVMITVPIRTINGGTSPMTRRTFSLLNSIFSDSLSFCSMSNAF